MTKAFQSREMDRRTFTRLVGFVAGAVAAGPVSELLKHPQAVGEALAQTPLAGVRSIRSTAKSWLWMVEDVALERGFFKRAGLEVGSTATLRGENTPALIGGGADVVLGNPVEPMRAALQRQSVVVFVGMVNKYASHVVVKKTIADRLGVDDDAPFEAKARALKGLKLGTTGPGASPDMLFRYIFRKAGMDAARDATLVTISGGGQGMLAALERSEIDGFCLSSPTSDLAVRKFGATYLFNMGKDPVPDLKDFLYIAATTTKRYAESNRAQILAYTKGVVDALRFIKTEREKFLEIVGKTFGNVDPELVQAAFPSNYPIYMDDPTPTKRHFELNMEFLRHQIAIMGQKTPVSPDTLKYEDVYTPEFAEQALRKS
jgi:NitT/TauT family transport system substrate-binding protein